MFYGEKKKGNKKDKNAFDLKFDCGTEFSVITISIM